VTTLYTVTDEAGKNRYWGISFQDAFQVWSDITEHARNVMTDVDCGGGSQLYEHGWRKKDNYKLLYDSGCGRCWDCK